MALSSFLSHPLRITASDIASPIAARLNKDTLVSTLETLLPDPELEDSIDAFFGLGRDRSYRVYALVEDADRRPIGLFTELTAPEYGGPAPDNATLSDVIQALKPDQFVSGDTPLEEVLRRFTIEDQSNHLVVLNGAVASHTISVSDLSGTSVRLAFFARITQLEEVLASFLLLDPQEGLSRLDGGERKKLTKKQSRVYAIRRANLEQKWHMFAGNPYFELIVTDLPRSSAETFIRKIVVLRNFLAHGVPINVDRGSLEVGFDNLTDDGTIALGTQQMYSWAIQLDSLVRQIGTALEPSQPYRRIYFRRGHCLLTIITEMKDRFKLEGRIPSEPTTLSIWRECFPGWSAARCIDTGGGTLKLIASDPSGIEIVWDSKLISDPGYRLKFM